jgi:leucyl aminopeptidase
MRLSLATPSPSTIAAGATDLLGIACDDALLASDQGEVASLDRLLHGALRKAIADERFRAKPGQALALHTLGQLPASRLLLVGMGPRASLEAPALRAFAGRAVRAAHAAGAKRLTLVAPRGAPFMEAALLPRALELMSAGALLGSYRFDKYLAEDKRAPRTVEDVEILVGAPNEALARALTTGARIAAAVASARDLVNEPAGCLTPTRLAAIASDLATTHGLSAEILGPDECHRLGMGLFLGVAQGSAEEPRLIHLAWRPPNARRRLLLVGKGVTFDSGGLSLKPNDGMLDMKTDMAGAAAVIAAICAISDERLPVEVHTVAACTENMPSGKSYKLGDILRAKSGRTVEINNTDAEGRLTLADAITYGREFAPDQILDFATLTGACMVALGPHTAGVMSNDEPLATAFLAAARAAGEDMWRLPLPERLLEQLKSDVADMKNTGERWGGALTAGLFLKEFVGDVPWVHVDIAGPSTADKELGDIAKGGTGFPVATIVEHVRRLASG